MCGIAGLVNFDQQSVSPTLLFQMTDAVAHRGPDGEGHWIEENVGIGHRRLAIIDPSSAGHQPMISSDGRFVLSYNGEVYNYLELRVRLESQGYLFHSNTDSEVVLNAWSEWGHEALNRFNGMFAFAIWDRRERKLFLARDRYGIKPMYFAHLAKRFYFGSEQKVMTADPRFRGELNKLALVEYLTFQNIFTNQTLTKDINLLPAGCFGELEVASQNWHVTKYWDFQFSEPAGRSDDREYLEELDRLIRQAVNRQLVSDVEIGSYLSGGIDSSVITALASPQMPNLKTFTIGFDLTSASGLELAFDERVQAEALASRLKTEHYELVLKSGDMERSLATLVHHLEEPRVGQSYPNFFAAKLASRFVKVVLSGTGGDELFGGYPWRYFKAGQSSSFETYVEEYYAYWQRLVSQGELQALLEPIWDDVKEVDTRQIFRDVFLSHNNSLERPEDYVNHSLYFESKTFLHGLLQVEDKLSMAHGLEARVPLLDNDLVDFAMKCPVRLKVNLSSKQRRLDENSLHQKKKRELAGTKEGKLILRRAVAGILGDEIGARQKQGFSSPDESWFRGESLDFVRKVLVDRVPSNMSEVFSSRSIRELVMLHVEGKQNRRLLIWSLLYLSHIAAQ